MNCVSSRNKYCVSQLRNNIQIQARTEGIPAVGTATPVHEYVTVLTSRCKVENRQGASPFAQINIGNEVITHVFVVRYTNVRIDRSNTVLDGKNTRYKILYVENVAEELFWMKIFCVQMGNADFAGAA